MRPPASTAGGCNHQFIACHMMLQPSGLVALVVPMRTLHRLERSDKPRAIIKHGRQCRIYRLPLESDPRNYIDGRSILRDMDLFESKMEIKQRFVKGLIWGKFQPYFDVEGKDFFKMNDSRRQRQQ